MALNEDIDTYKINKRSLFLCQTIYNNVKILDVFFSNTENVENFSKIMIPGYYKNSYTPIQGCYILHSTFKDKTYVAQSSFLSKPIREHAVLPSKATLT